MSKAIDYSALSLGEQYDFRRGFFAGSGATRMGDVNLHAWLLTQSPAPVTPVVENLAETFGVVYAAGYMLGATLSGELKKRLNPEYKTRRRFRATGGNA